MDDILVSASVRQDFEVDRNPLPIWMRWIRSSPDLLIEAERKLLNRLRSRLQSYFVPIFNKTSFIRTIIADKSTDTGPISNCDAQRGAKDTTPLVLVHGFASGLALWCKNIDSLTAYRRVYAFDVLGFGRSSRPTFSNDAAEAEEMFVRSFEEWRSAMSIDKFILVGHSLGGYISAAYALAYPNHIVHLVLVDPWGFHESPVDEQTLAENRRRFWLFRTVQNMVGLTNPLSVLRGIGPLGRRVIHNVRHDLRGVFDQRSLVEGQYFEVPKESDEEVARHAFLTTPTRVSETDHNSPGSEPNGAFRIPAIANDNPMSPHLVDLDDLDGSVALDYVYHINVQTPSGEVGFKSLCTRIGWAQRPLLNRIAALDRTIPISFIYGSRSWLDISSGTKTRALRAQSYVDVKIIEGAGHQVYAQAAEEFNEYVNFIARRVDLDDPFLPFDPENPPRWEIDDSLAKQSPGDERAHRKRPAPTTNSRIFSYFLGRRADDDPSVPSEPTPSGECSNQYDNISD